jgi:hypothetical protein
MTAQSILKMKPDSHPTDCAASPRNVTADSGAFQAVAHERTFCKMSYYIPLKCCCSSHNKVARNTKLINDVSTASHFFYLLNHPKPVGSLKTVRLLFFS